MVQKNQNPNQLHRPRPVGPERVICAVIEKATSRTVVEAAGRATRKESAQARARQNALRALKRKLRRRFVSSQYELAYRYG